MPIMIYYFLCKAMEKHGRPVTTEEIRQVALEMVPMCADHVVEHLPVLERHGLVKKTIDKEKKAVYWSIVPPKRTPKQLAEEFPDLYLESMYYHALSEEISGKPMDMDEAVRLLAKITGRSPQRIPVEEVKRRLKRILPSETSEA
ncbi:MAG: hypothetical protein DRN06_07740 [Thermoprotei archaeon]|nr:MAG: hypothetical protein DRN06_07740 [Thermoprotei archaeon]